MKKLVAIIPIFMMMLFTFTGLASAHVKVYPENVQKGAYEKFTVRVPSEKDVPTTMVKIEIAEDNWSYYFINSNRGNKKIFSVKKMKTSYDILRHLIREALLCITY